MHKGAHKHSASTVSWENFDKVCCVMLICEPKGISYPSAERWLVNFEQSTSRVCETESRMTWQSYREVKKLCLKGTYSDVFWVVKLTSRLAWTFWLDYFLGMLQLWLPWCAQLLNIGPSCDLFCTGDAISWRSRGKYTYTVYNSTSGRLTKAHKILFQVWNWCLSLSVFSYWIF